MKINSRNLKYYLDKATSELNRGEKVQVEMNDDLHSKYLDLQMSGHYRDLMCIKSNGSYFLARIR